MSFHVASFLEWLSILCFFFLLSEILCKFEEQEDFTVYFFVYDMTHHKFVVNHVIIINTV